MIKCIKFFRLFISFTVFVLLLTGAISVYTPIAEGVPAMPGVRTHMQSDASLVSYQVAGDEFLNYMIDSNGDLLSYGDDGDIYYANWVNESDFAKNISQKKSRFTIPTNKKTTGRHANATPLSEKDMRPLRTPIPKFISEHTGKLIEERHEGWREQRRKSSSAITAPGKDLTGSEIERNLLVIYVRFEDESNIPELQNKEISNTDIFNLVFNEAYRGSIAHYYRTVTGGRVKYITAKETYGTKDDGIVRVTLPGKHKGLPTGSDWPGDIRGDVIKPALLAVAPFINFSDYYNNSHGYGYLAADELSILLIVHGYEGAITTGPAIWAHSWVLDDYVANLPIVNGVRIAYYCVVGAFHSKGSNPRPFTSGVAAHELGHHSFGFFDFYELSNNRTRGIAGAWSLMGQGNWGAAPGEPAGMTPTGLDAYHLSTLSPPTATVSAANLDAGQQFSLVDNTQFIKLETAYPKQYYLLQPRGNVGYDRGFLRYVSSWPAPYGGLMIYHLDEDKSPFVSGTNTIWQTHPFMDIEEAHGGTQHLQINSGEGTVDDLFYGTKNKFDGATDPNSNLYASSSSTAQTITSGLSVTEISPNVTGQNTPGGSLTVTFKIGTKNLPETSVTGVTILPKPVSIAVGKIQTLTAAIAPANATNRNVTWSSDKTAIATVNAFGVIAGVSAGITTITVKTDDGGFTDSCTVMVTATEIGDSPDNPIIITTAAQLDAVRDGLHKHYRLGNNIDLTSYLSSGGEGFNKWRTEGWMPVGTGSTAFTGSLDGAGYKVTGLWINRGSMSFVGLFGFVLNSKITNLGVEIASAGVKGSDSVGGLVGSLMGTNTIIKCYAVGSVSGINSVGGLVGYQYPNNGNSTIAGCCAIANVIGNRNVGGLVGMQYNFGGDNNIINSYATGNAAGNESVGGLVGEQNASSSSNNRITNSYTTCDVMGDINVGGLVGCRIAIHLENNNITNSYATGNTTGSRNVGGIVGMQNTYDNNPIKNSYRYQYATVNGLVLTENTPNGIHGGIKTAVELTSKATYTGNSWLFNDSTPEVGPWHWDNRGFPKLNMGNENYPFPFNATVSIPPTITTFNLPAGTVMKTYYQILTASGTSPIVWSLGSRTQLPPGLMLDRSTGTISGRPTRAGTYSFLVAATNDAGSNFKLLSIVVEIIALEIDFPRITTSELPGGTIRRAYSETLSATGRYPISWSVYEGDLPPGLVLDPSTGEISGIPIMAGTFDFVVEAMNRYGSDMKELSIEVGGRASDAPRILERTLSSGVIGLPYSRLLRVSHKAARPITWSLAFRTNLPPGLILDSRGIISGTPTTAGTFSFVIEATNRYGSDTKELCINVRRKAFVIPPPEIITSELQSGLTGVFYSETLSAFGGRPLFWSIYKGDLPPGLILDSSTGEINGMPTTAGTFDFVVEATNGFGSDTKEMSISILRQQPMIIIGPPKVATTALQAGMAGVFYSQTLSAIGRTPIFWSIYEGDLPPGLILDPSTGEISGIPTMAGTFDFVVAAANRLGSDTKELSIEVIRRRLEYFETQQQLCPLCGKE